MADSDKQILITPNIGPTALPQIKFIGKDNAPMYQTIQDDGTIAFNGAQGEVFSIGPTMATGNVFAVSDISGIPLLEVNSNSNITIRGNITSTSTNNYNLYWPLYFQRDNLGTSNIDMRLPVAGGGTTTPNNFSMPRAGKVMALTLHYYGGTLSTASNKSDTWRIRHHSGGTADVTNVDIVVTMDPLVATANANNRTKTIELSSPLTFAANDSIAFKRNANANSNSIHEVNAVLWIQFDA